VWQHINICWQCKQRDKGEVFMQHVDNSTLSELNNQSSQLLLCEFHYRGLPSANSAAVARMRPWDCWYRSQNVHDDSSEEASLQGNYRNNWQHPRNICEEANITIEDFLNKRRSYPCNRPWNPIGLLTSRLPHFLVSRLTDDGEFVSFTRRPPFTPPPPRRFLVLIPARGWLDSRVIVRFEGLG
jgi:hypothetical protein